MDKPTYGGQAVIEGVMMRGPRDMAVSVRDPDGRVVIHTEPLGSIYTSRWSRVPVVRGAILLWNTLALGFRSLVFSANVAASIDEDGGEASNGEQPDQMPSGMLWGSMIVGLAFSVGLFFVLPVVVVSLLDQYIGSNLVSNAAEKVLRLGLIIGYIGFIGLIPDIRRVYAYHGAEHKTINAYEVGAALDVESVRRFSTRHPRCGTTFLMVFVLISFIAFMLLGQPGVLLRILSRVVLIPLVAGLAYEVIRFGAVNCSRPLVRMLMAPGLAVQALTTREPDDSQLDVAIRALQTVIALEDERRRATIGVAQPRESQAAVPGAIAASG